MHEQDTDPLCRYIAALEAAAEQIDIARRLRRDHGLDHAHDRLRAMIAQAARELYALETLQPPDAGH